MSPPANRARPSKASQGPGMGRRRAARLAAVQALYEIEMTGAAPEPVIAGLLERRWAPMDEGSPATSPTADSDLLRAVVAGVGERRTAIDAALAGALTGQWSLERMEILLRAILRAGAYEILCAPAVPPAVVLAEYVAIAHAFYGGNEPGLVNAVLDRLVAEHGDRAPGAERRG